MNGRLPFFLYIMLQTMGFHVIYIFSRKGFAPIILTQGRKKCIMSAKHTNKE